MTFDELKECVLSVILEEGKLDVHQSMVTTWLNHAQLDLAARLKVLRKRVTGTVAAGVVALPADNLEILTLSVGGEAVGFTSDAAFNSWKEAKADVGHTLARVASAGTEVELYPAPAVGTAYVLDHVRSPATMGPAQAPELPAHLHKKMCDFARAEALDFLGATGRSDRYMARYEQGLPSPSTDRPRFVPAPFSLTVAAGPFDTGEWDDD